MSDDKPSEQQGEQQLRRQRALDEQQAKAARAWAAQVEAMRARAAAVDWSKVDWSRLNAKDIGVQMGPPMTEAQFAEYRRRQGGRPVHVIRRDAGGAEPPRATGQKP